MADENRLSCTCRGVGAVLIAQNDEWQVSRRSFRAESLTELAQGMRPEPLALVGAAERRGRALQ